MHNGSVRGDEGRRGVEQLKRIILESEDRLVSGVIGYARSAGFASRMPAVDETYRVAVSTISANLVQTLSISGGIPDLRADEDVEGDAIAALGGRFARARRGDTKDGATFLGMLAYVRRAYEDVVRDAEVPHEDQREILGAIQRYFDHLQVGFAAAWDSFSPDDVSRATIESSREVVREKNRYLSAFGDLPLPVLFLDDRGNVENMNLAASSLFRPLSAGRGIYRPEPAKREAPPVLRAELREFAASEDRSRVLEREIKTGKGTRYFEARFTKLSDPTGAGTGMLVVLTDLTYRRTAEEALRRSQAKYVSLFENMLTGFAYMKVVLDRRNRPSDYTFLEVNDAFVSLTGLSAADIIGRALTEVLPGIEASRFDWLGTLGKVALTGETASFDALVEGLGRWYAVSAYSSAPGHITLMLSDISELKWVEQSLAHSRDFYLTLFEGFPTLIWRAGTDGSHDYFNASWLEFTGRKLAQTVGDGWAQDVHPDDRERRAAVIAKGLKDRLPFSLEYRLKHHSGEYRWVLDSGRPFREAEGGFAGLIGSVQDISDRKRQEEQLQHLATHDELTNLPNRRVFEEALERAVAHARRGHPSSLLFIDVDGFKDVNDSLGHADGDQTLVNITEVIRGTTRAEDLIARIGGDEFAALLTDTVLTDARRVAERIRECLQKQRLAPQGWESPITLSIGLVEVDGLTEADSVLAQADSAMYRAKDSGGDRVVTYTPGFETHELDSATGSMLAKLKDALVRDGALMFHYQPVFRVGDGSIEYFEALTRLVDREQRVISPGQFITVAERFGLMPQFTRWVARRAANVLMENPGVRLSVNLSGLDLDDGALLDDVLRYLRDHSVDPGRLSFEMSEASVLRDVSAAREWIARSRDAGIGFALDDFGAGFNSFAYLRSLPVNRVKIDGSVTRSLVTDPRQLTLLEAVHAVTTAEGVETVAECVENEYVLEIVRDVGLDFAQGFHMGRPGIDLSGVAVEWASRFPKGRTEPIEPDEAPRG
jgi:diguanylate cyclase (GGDEF)-like protein/PAS domain S-box-containing protein